MNTYKEISPAQMEKDKNSMIVEDSFDNIEVERVEDSYEDIEVERVEDTIDNIQDEDDSDTCLEEDKLEKARDCGFDLNEFPEEE